MGYQTLMLQARCAALGFDPGPLDGVDGKKTRAAIELAAQSQREKNKPFMHPSGISMIRIHWTAGNHNPSIEDQSHYHELIKGDGTVLTSQDPNKKLAHTKNANSGALAISLCGMRGANEKPFRKGDQPINMLQLKTLVDRIIFNCQKYDIPVSKFSVQTHAEVEPLLGIKQEQKWDITWLPDMDVPGDAIEVGERIRNAVRYEIARFKGV